MSEKRPIIGITTSYPASESEVGSGGNGQLGGYLVRQHYAAAVERAGGLGVMLPFGLEPELIPGLLDRLDGVLLSGGDDLDPALWGETWHPKVKPCHPARQRFELALVAEVDRRGMPVLGICLGCQVMNVHRRGSLIQFLPEHSRQEAIEHRRDGPLWVTHPVRLHAGSVVTEAVGSEQLTVNSSHKQAVGRVGQGLVASATAPDGVIEGIEDPSARLYLGVQWHPERLFDEPDHLALFRILVDRCRSG